MKDAFGVVGGGFIEPENHRSIEPVPARTSDAGFPPVSLAA